MTPFSKHGSFVVNYGPLPINITSFILEARARVSGPSSSIGDPGLRSVGGGNRSPSASSCPGQLLSTTRSGPSDTQLTHKNKMDTLRKMARLEDQENEG